MKAGVITLILLLCYGTAFSQMSSSPREMFLEAESYFLYEEYKEALPLYIQLSLSYPENDNINYRIGRCYLNIPYEKEKSILYLETASKNINPQYKGESLKEVAAPPDVIYYLADAYRINNQIDKALVLYRQFKSLSDSSVFNLKMVDEQIKACENAKILESHPVKVTFTNLGEGINTRFSETNAVVSGNETVLVFSAQLQFYTAVFYSHKENGQWSHPVNINANLEVDDDCLPVAISYDGKELLLYRSNEYLGDLYVSRFINGKWSRVKHLNNNINTKYWESHACLSRDGKKIYFTSNRKESTGGLDIFVSTRQNVKSDDWGKPQKLDSGINTVYDEETPFITADDRWLYFSSNGHNSMGGFDVFVSENKFGKWMEPQNLGYPLNTTDNDLFYQPAGNGEEGYMALSRKDTYGKNDIYKIKISNALPETTGDVFAPETKAEDIKEQEAQNLNQNTNVSAVIPVINAQYTQSHKENSTTKEDHKFGATSVQFSLAASGKKDQAKSAETDNDSLVDNSDTLNQSLNIDSDTDTNLTPGQKQAWHKLLYGGLGILGVFTFFILFLFLRSRKRKK
jgi:tetratricopeptide (TPR) repeat protein